MCESGRKRPVSRGQRLKLIGAGTAGAVLAACAPRIVVAPPEEPAEPTEEPVEVEAEEPEATEEPAEEAAEPTEAPAAEGKIDIAVDFQGRGPGRDGSAGMALEALLSSYHELHPHVSVNHRPIDAAAWDDIQAWTEQRLVAQDDPDMLLCSQTALIERWMEAGLIGFCDPYLRASNSYVPRQHALGEPVHSTLRDAVEWQNGVDQARRHGAWDVPQRGPPGPRWGSSHQRRDPDGWRVLWPVRGAGTLAGLVLVDLHEPLSRVWISATPGSERR